MGTNRTPKSGQRGPVRLVLQKIWSPEDYAEFERRADEAMALTRAISEDEAKAMHPATVSKQSARRSGTRPASVRACEVIDLFTRTRVR